MRVNSVRRPKSAAVAIAVVLGVAVVPDPLLAWGFTAHRMVNAKAIGTLPEPVAAFFDGNRAYVVEHAIDPDLWRESGRPDEGPNHYLDLDAFGAFPFPDVPRTEAEHLARHGATAAQKGRVPWRIAEVYRDLVAAFRARDPGRVLERAAILGHYVGDAHVPLHAAVNYDGQLTGQNGVHARWEAEMVERFVTQLEAAVLPAAARRGAEPVAVAFDALLSSYARSLEGLEADRAVAGPRDYADTAQDDRYDDRYYSRFFEREGKTLVARLASSATAVGSLWLSAWEDAGRPDLDANFRVPYVRKQSRLVLLSLDGASQTLVRDAIARGIMPNLARLERSGASASSVLTSRPAKTTTGNATIFTGTWPDRHGISGGVVSVPPASLLENVSGYRSEALRAEPFWVAAARQGLDVAVVSATQDFPFAPFQEERRFGGNYASHLTIFDGYKGPGVEDAAYGAGDLALRPAEGWSPELRAGSGARELELRVAGTPVAGLLYDDPDDPQAGFDTLLLSLKKDGKGAARLKPRPVGPDAEAWAGLSIPTAGAEIGAFFRLFELAPDASRILLYQAKAGSLVSNKPLLPAAALRATGGFVGNGASGLYLKGALGPPLFQGGDGTAEKRYLETVRLVTRQFGRLAEFAALRTRWDVLLTYLPYPDEASHLWLGLLDPSLEGHDVRLASRVRPFEDEMLRVVDDGVGELAKRAEADVVLAVVADHGEATVRTWVRPNVALAAAGMLALDSDGKPDLARTRALYLPDCGCLAVNRAARKGGIVPPEQEDAVVRDVVAMLRGLRDPATGRSVVTAVIDARSEGKDRGLGGPHGGDVYFDLARGYHPSGEAVGALFETRRAAGEHLLDPERAEMQPVFLVTGNGVATGAALGRVRQIDVAPTLAALLGIDPPAQATGAVLQPALARVGSTATTPQRH
jgi:predicted AlkP superfamily phosphohydrolase/phosphomutase